MSSPMFPVSHDPRDHVDVNREEGEAYQYDQHTGDSNVDSHHVHARQSPRSSERLPPASTSQRVAANPLELQEPRLMVKTLFHGNLCSVAALQKRCEPIRVEVEEKRTAKNQHPFYFVRCQTLDEASALYARLVNEPDVYHVEAAKPNHYGGDHKHHQHHRNVAVLPSSHPSRDNRDARGGFRQHPSSHTERQPSQHERQSSQVERRSSHSDERRLQLRASTDHRDHRDHRRISRSHSRSSHRGRTLETERRRAHSRSRSRSRDRTRQEESHRHTSRRNPEEGVRVSEYGRAEPEQSGMAPVGADVAGSGGGRDHTNHQWLNNGGSGDDCVYGDSTNARAVVSSHTGAASESSALILSPVAPDVSLAELRKHMERSGAVKIIYMTDDGTTTYAHVVFETSAAATTALAAWDGTIGELSKRLVRLQAWFAPSSTSTR